GSQPASRLLTHERGLDLRPEQRVDAVRDASQLRQARGSQLDLGALHGDAESLLGGLRRELPFDELDPLDESLVGGEHRVPRRCLDALKDRALALRREPLAEEVPGARDADQQDRADEDAERLQHLGGEVRFEHVILLWEVATRTKGPRVGWSWLRGADLLDDQRVGERD